MANTKTSGMTLSGALLPGDGIHISRAGGDYQLLGSNIVSAAAAAPAQFIPANNAIVAKGGYLNAIGTNSGFVQSGRRSPVIVGGQPVKSIRLVYWNGYLASGEKNGMNPVTVECGLESTAPVQTVMATFAGQASITIAAGAYAISDPIYPGQFGFSVFPANWFGYARTGMTVSSTSMKWPSPDLSVQIVAGQPVFIATSLSASQISATGSFTIPSGGQGISGAGDYAFAPQAILGEWAGTPDISVFLSGDSIITRLNDNQDNGSTGGGFAVNGLRSVGGRSVPFILASHAGEAASNWASGNAFRQFIMQFCTHYIDNFGTNDIFNGRTSAQALADKQSMWAAFRTKGKAPARVINVPVTPKTSSTDSWATLANQTPFSGYASGSTRDTLNNAVLGVLGTSTGPDETINVNTIVQDATATDKWVVNGAANYATSDSVHPSAALHVLVSPLITAAAAKWSVSTPISGSIRVVTAAGTITTTSTDYTIVVNKTTGAATAVMLNGTPGQVIVIKDGKGDAATNSITITPTSGTIDGSATLVININKASATLQFDGSNWWIE